MPGSKRQSSKPRPWDQDRQAEGAAFGAWLKRQREIREIGLAEIADHTKISLRYLEALEAGRFDLLPAQVFAKGFLKEYARYVGLSPDEVVNSYLTALEERDAEEGGDDEESAGERPHRLRRRLRRWFGPAVLLLALAAAAVGLTLARSGEHTGPARERPSLVPPPQPSVAVPAGPVTEAKDEEQASVAATEPTPPRTDSSSPGLDGTASPAAAPLEVVARFARQCWVEATIDGSRRISELHPAGDVLELRAEQRVELTLGDAGAVSLEVNGHPLAVQQGAGQVVRNLEIDLPLAASLAQQAP